MKCKYCKGEGFVKYNCFNKLLQREYEYVFLCICDKGESYKGQYPLPQASRDKLDLLYEAEQAIKEGCK